MAKQSMKELYRGLEADQAEMDRYRAGLAGRLEAPRRRVPLWPPLLAAAALAALAIVLLILPRPGFPQRDLADIKALAASGNPKLLGRAGVLAERGKGLNRWNAHMILCLTAPEEQAIQQAAEGVQEDPRPEFRAYYLEYLLDHADERRYNPHLLERLMDRESDRLCMHLYRELYRLTL